MTVLVVFGTRPEAIKLAPVIAELRRSFDVRVCVTGQHREMLDQVLQLFSLTPDYDLGLMQPDLIDLAAATLVKVREVIRACNPRLVIVQGDTTSAMAAGLAAFYEGIDVAHVEAGLRSFDLDAPWPEEANRRLLSVVARVHFAPTEEARAQLEREGATNVHVTGNTVIDALLRVNDVAVPYTKRLLLVTSHRRESFGDGLESICHALLDLVRAHDDIEIVYPVHLNPNVHEPVQKILGAHDRVHLIAPVDYATFVALMRRATLILSDSGGVQEEAPSLGKAVLVLRDCTERPEAVRAGNARLVGTDRARIVEEASGLLRDPARLAGMSQVRHVYGDGRAAERIAAVLRAQYPPRMPNPRLELLAHSDSGLHYVREKKSGILRRLTDDELRDFNDPPPCETCGEQFGCEHYNCAREPLLDDTAIEAEVPETWRAFARAAGISRNDLERLRVIEHRDGEYQLAPSAPTDMRTLELVLLLNEQ